MAFLDPTSWRPGERLRASKLNELVTAIRSINIFLSRREAAPERTHRKEFLAKITGNSALIAGAKWKYAWTEIQLDENGDDAALNGARSGTTSSGWALNLCEVNNTSSSAIGGDGVNPSGSDYPAGFARRPIGSSGTSDTHGHDVIVVMRIVGTSDGTTQYVFSQPNAHDGTCE